MLHSKCYLDFFPSERDIHHICMLVSLFRCHLHSWLSPFPPCFRPPVFLLDPLGLSGAQLRQKEDLAKRIIGQEFPWMGDCASAWDNAVDTVMRDLGEGFELRRHNKANVRFRCCRLRHGTSFGLPRISSELPVSHNIGQGEMNFVVRMHCPSRAAEVAPSVA